MKGGGGGVRMRFWSTGSRWGVSSGVIQNIVDGQDRLVRIWSMYILILFSCTNIISPMTQHLGSRHNLFFGTLAPQPDHGVELPRLHEPQRLQLPLLIRRQVHLKSSLAKTKTYNLAPGNFESLVGGQIERYRSLPRIVSRNWESAYTSPTTQCASQDTS